MVTLLPNSPLSAVLDQVARQTDRLFEAATGLDPSTAQSLAPAWPGVNLWRQGSQIIAEAEIPGFSSEGVQVHTTDSTLAIRGERIPRLPQGAVPLRIERCVTQFERSFQLPAPIDPEGVQASLNNGVLRVTMPIAQAALPRRVQVRAGNGPAELAASDHQKN